jgi:hypothetical protein
MKHQQRLLETSVTSAEVPDLLAIAGVTRRRFLASGAALGGVLGASLLTSCLGGGGDDAPAPDPLARTLFFDLSHHDTGDRTYFLIGGGHRHALVSVADKPEVLAAARKSNAFLAEVADEHITHHIEGAVFAGDSPTLTYLASAADATGAWSMAAVYLQIPAVGATHAYSRARAKTPAGPLPLSVHRSYYGARAALTEQDLIDERMLLGPPAHAATILGAHAELFSLESSSAHHIHSNHIDPLHATEVIANALSQPEFGPGKPEVNQDDPNAKGWATLIPVIDDSTGKPFVNTKGRNVGYNQYVPRLHPVLAQFAGPAMAEITASVGDDESLGADVTTLDPRPGAPADFAYTGKMWARQDGTAFVDSSGAAPAVSSGSVVMTCKQDPGQYLTRLNATSTTTGTLTTVNMRLLNAATRFLGVYLQFFSDANPDKPLLLEDIPEYKAGTIIDGHPNDNDQLDAMFVGILGSAITVMAVPVGPAFMFPSFKLPSGVTTVRVLMSGLGTGANTHPDTLLLGEIMTGVVSYGITSLMCACGAAIQLQPIIDSLVTPFMTGIALELALLATSVNFNGKGPETWQFWAAQALLVGKLVAQVAVGKSVGPLLTKLLFGTITANSTAFAEDEIPLVGWVMLGVSVAVGVASLLETSIEVVLSPKTYVWELGFTHDVTVTVTHDSTNSAFPADATHCIVTTTFGDAIPHRQTLSMNGRDLTKSIDVTFPSVPLGGSIAVSVALIQQAIPGQASILLGKGSTGNLVNGPTVAPAIQITQLPFPLGPQTVYRHKRKTALTVAGVHYWNTTAAPPVATQPACAEAGTMCKLNSISVRQGTSAGPGYVGYAWQSQNLDPSVAPGCASQGAGQLDQMANVNTDDGTSGYAVTTCGYEVPGVQLAYDLLPSSLLAPVNGSPAANPGGRNFYLDTSGSLTGTWHLRQVVLDASPHFDQSASKSWGVLNFLPDVLLLHPAGHVVSISSANNKIESLQLPKAGLADSDALVSLLAQTHCGEGSRPGRLTQPLTASVAADGTIIVLENGDPNAVPPVPTRLQALTVGGNPKKHFTGQTGSSNAAYFFELTETPASNNWTLLDVAVEYTGAIYVLSITPDGICQLDIYLHDQVGTKPLCTTAGINASKLAVDFWRGVYTLNNDVIARDDGAPPRLTEPSVSLWEPCNQGQTCT